MDLAAIMMLLAVAALIGLFVTRPLVRRLPERNMDGQGPSALLAERDRLLNALQDLDFDHMLGKVSEQEYPAQRMELVRRGADLLRQLDGLAPSQAGENTAPETLGSAVPALAAKPASAAISDEDIEALIARRRSARQEEAASFCPKCGQPVLPSAAFCSSCGAPLR